MKRSPLKRRTPLRVRRGPNRLWRMVRREVEGRANGWCEVRVEGVCAGRGAHAHHILLRSAGGVDDPSNLAWTCAPCHGHIHDHPAWSYEHGWLRRKGSA